MLGLFKKKTIPFSEILCQMNDKIITETFQCHFYSDRYRGEIYEWQLDKKFYAGDQIKVIEFYSIDNIVYRNTFIHIVTGNK